MKIFTFDEFMNGLDNHCEGHNIYAVFRGKECLYIGMSNDNIYNRWFSERGHMPRRIDGARFGGSAIGRMIVENLPESLGWAIRLYTVDDCRQDIIDYIHPYPLVVKDEEWEKNSYGFVDTAEEALIKKWKPRLNVINNPRYSSQ